MHKYNLKKLAHQAALDYRVFHFKTRRFLLKLAYTQWKDLLKAKVLELPASARVPKVGHVQHLMGNPEFVKALQHGTSRQPDTFRY